MGRPLAIGGEHVGLREGLGDGGSGDSEDVGAVLPTQEHDGDGDHEGVLPRVLEGAGVDDGRRPAEEEQQAEEGEEREEEARRGDAGEDGESREVVGPAAALPAGEDAEGEPDEERQREGVEGEEAGDGGLSGELRSDGLAVDEGVAAEGAVEHGAEPAGVLDGEGVVEAELDAKGLADLRRVGGLAAAGEDGGSDVAGEGAHDGEDDDGRKERRGQDEGESAGEVGVRHGDGRSVRASFVGTGYGMRAAPVSSTGQAIRQAQGERGRDAPRGNNGRGSGDAPWPSPSGFLPAQE